MARRGFYTHSLALRALAASLATVAAVQPAYAQEQVYSFDIPAQDLDSALKTFARVSGQQVVFNSRDARGKTAPALKGSYSARAALDVLLRGSGLVVERGKSGLFLIHPPRASEASETGVPTNEIVVTAQKRVEKAQDVPIAISAFSAEDLSKQKIEGGFDLMKAVPNLTFSKSNFSSYNISIRGIGTKSISTTSDPGVSVSFNNTGLIRNRLFEQEYFDVERVEVLRGPQGTLYGRNATAGVINLITAKPKLSEVEGSIKGELGNFRSRRAVGMLNLPIIDNVLGIRLAGSMTKRQGYDYNTVTESRVNGRDLWSFRTTIGFEPTPSVRANLVWERFHEKDDRSRTGKQLCHRDDSPTMIGSSLIVKPGNPRPQYDELRRALFSTGCKAGSLYDDAAFGTPNGLALSPITGLTSLNLIFGVGTDADGNQVSLLNATDPYRGAMQSKNLREIASFNNPIYRARADLLQFNLDVDLSDALTLSSQSLYNWDQVYSFQDFNRFNTGPIWNDTSQFLVPPGGADFRGIAPGGVFCDPQIGCSSTIGTFDVASSKSRQFSQEVRLQSSFDGPFNFSFGANYTKFKAQEDYIVMSNVLTALAATTPLNFSGNLTECSLLPSYFPNPGPLVPIRDSFCPYIDPNPVATIDGDGHNYFRSSNPYQLKSYAAFGEAYWNINPDLKLTAGLRYTLDKKRFTPMPSQLLLSPTLLGGGLVGTGLIPDPDIHQKWGVFTGRLGIDWKPVLSFTDETMLYAFVSRGYKGGGANPPTPGYASGDDLVAAGLLTQEQFDQFSSFFNLDVLNLTGAEYERTFKPEYVNSFEIGAKNSFFGGGLILNLSAFYYDYKDYQVSQIRDRTAVNENFDAKTMGAELQAVLAPTRDLRFIANVGYLRTKIGKGESSIDIMNRTLGDPRFTVFRPWVQLPSNCVVPVGVAESWANTTLGINDYWSVCGGVGGIIGAFTIPVNSPRPIDPATGLAYDDANYPELNGGAGLRTDLSGNELPNSPRWTVNVGGEYTLHFGDDWSATIRADAYWQAKSWARVYNLNPYDRLKSWTNYNLTLGVDAPEGLHFEAYVKNLFNSTPITDAFLNSDDAALTTNIFTLDPRIIGFSIAKKF